MNIQSMTIDLKFEPRLMVNLLKICTEALEGAAERIEQLEARATVDANARVLIERRNAETERQNSELAAIMETQSREMEGMRLRAAELTVPERSIDGHAALSRLLKAARNSSFEEEDEDLRDAIAEAKRVMGLPTS